MSSKKNAAKKAAADAAKAASKESTKVETKVENKKEEKVNAPQVAAPAATAKKEEAPKAPAPTPKKEEKKQEPKAEAKTSDKQTAQKGTAQQEKPKAKSKVPTVIAEEVDATALGRQLGIPIDGAVKSSQSSTDAKAMLVNYGYQRFINNKEFKEQYPEKYAQTAQAIDAVWLLAMVEVKNEFAERTDRGEFIVQISPDQIIPLNEVAEMMGIKLAAPKAIEGPNGEQQLAIDFGKAEAPDELKDKHTANMGGAAPEVPELDIEKISTDEQIKAALEYLIRKDRNIAVNLVNTVEWYRTLRITKEQNTDKRLKLDDRTVFDWITEIFSIIEPSGLFNGLGKAVYMYTAQHQSPIVAHSLLRTHMKPMGWNDEQVMQAAKALIQERFRMKQKENSELKVTEDKALQALVNNLGNDYITKVLHDYHMIISSDEDPKKKIDLEEAKKNATKIIQNVRMNFFPEKTTPTDDQLRMVIGQVINLYRDPMDRLAEYEVAKDIVVSGEYPATEQKPAEEKPVKQKPAEKKN